MKKIALLLVFCLLFFTACQDEPKVTLEKKMARHVTEDGWVYTFDYCYFSDGIVRDEVPPYTFSGINLRHRIGPANSDVARMQYLGDGSEAERRDMEKIAAYLGYETGAVRPTAEALLGVDASMFSFETVDAELFVALIKKALGSEPLKDVGDLAFLPRNALLAEPSYIDGYKFQIGFSSSMGSVNVIMIDVLYEGENGEVQLFDLCKADKATAEQEALYSTIETIAEGIVRENELCFGKDIYAKSRTADVNLGRLYTFLSAIEQNDFGLYVVKPE